MTTPAVVAKAFRAARHPSEIPSRILNRIEVARDRSRVARTQTFVDPSEWLEQFHFRSSQSWPCSFCARTDSTGAELVGATGTLGSNSHDLDPSVANILWSLMIHVSPSTVIETGVARGVSSRLILEALDLRGEGLLWSIDLPPLSVSPASIGIFVPERLKARWRYIRGGSRTTLPEVLAAAGPVGGFVHDSLHTYRTMDFEFRTVFPYLDGHAFVVADDVEGNAAFDDFVDRHPEAWSTVVRHDGKEGAFGVMVFSAAATPK